MTIKILSAKLRAPTVLDDGYQKGLLDEHAKKAFKNVLNRKLFEELLALGGAHVVFPKEDVHLKEILTHGRLFTKRTPLPRAAKKLCEDNQCHWNALTVQQKYPDLFNIATGYYLQKNDGLWRSHTWLVGKKDMLVYETTVPAVGYFGVILTATEVKKFRSMYK